VILINKAREREREKERRRGWLISLGVFIVAFFGEERSSRVLLTRIKSSQMSDWFVPPGEGEGENEKRKRRRGGKRRAPFSKKKDEKSNTNTHEYSDDSNDEERAHEQTESGDDDDSERRERERQKVYQIWPGNDKFFWDGRIIVGPNYKAFLNTIVLVLVPSVVFTSAVAPDLSREYSWAWQAVSTVWPIYVIACLVRTGTMDPGILPRLPRPPPRDRNDPPRERVRDVPHEPTKKLVTVKWNDTTNFFQPPRAHHCSINNDCVEKFDHHCPWVGTTIGRRNYRHFLLFVFGTTLWCGFVVGSCVLSILVEIDERNDEVDPATGKSVNTQAVTGALRASGAALFCGIIALFGFMFVFALSAFHVVLIWQNQTTYENFRERSDAENPYTRGNCCKNCFEIFCEPIPPSWFDFRQYADEDDSADRFAEHMRKRGLLLQEQDPEIAKKETEKRLAEFTEDLEKVKEKIAYKQNLELSEQALLEEGKSREEEGIGMKMKNALVNVFGSNSIGTKTFKEKRGNVDEGKEGDNEDGNDNYQDEELGGFESPVVFDENYVPDILRQQQSSDEDGGSEASVSSRGGSSDIDERKRRFQQEKGRKDEGGGAERESNDDDQQSEKDDDDNAEKEEEEDDDDCDDDRSSSLSDSERKPIDERDTEADNEERSDTSSSEDDDMSSSSSFSSSSKRSTNTSISTGSSSSLSSGGSVDRRR
jgi:palmitoyltransferase ZDHHC9/14/18